MRPAPDHRTFRAWCRLLRQAFPTRYKVHFRRVERLDGYGECIWWEDKDTGEVTHEIRIRQVSSPGMCLDTLIHEYAHALREEMSPPSTDDGHDLMFRGIHWTIKNAWPYLERQHK